MKYLTKGIIEYGLLCTHMQGLEKNRRMLEITKQENKVMLETN